MYALWRKICSRIWKSSGRVRDRDYQRPGPVSYTHLDVYKRQVNVMTGIYTGRSPKDKYIVMDENSKDTVWWTSDEYPNDNHPASQEAWDAVKDIAKNELSNKRLFVVDAFCGANKDTRMAIRFIVEVAWQAHFVTNMFIRPTAEELENFEPDFVVYNASKAKVENYKELGLRSETAVMFNITSREQVIVNTWYGGEMKKGMSVSYTHLDVYKRQPVHTGLWARSPQVWAQQMWLPAWLPEKSGSRCQAPLSLY